jgi:hypothetical protein
MLSILLTSIFIGCGDKDEDTATEEVEEVVDTAEEENSEPASEESEGEEESGTEDTGSEETEDETEETPEGE